MYSSRAVVVGEVETKAAQARLLGRNVIKLEQLGVYCYEMGGGRAEE
jgi:hypothetical protein